ncbi:hypothetical protein IVB33_18945 [Bradyrhizobium sp. 24]|uniref:hypothetical protein n=1 Tax=unclassified Bradyrhizobium TaxID=2631580 RepID=UPI001FF99895|nr:MULTISPECIES: hypothetical protein [unclassified Bradyrhizobium]MCK1299613.1 hypothetical protein [Bradyrhizobium sp. 37]MCK1379596.1 hypothetical protein [Bradyrhizobium sp. 24]MCK1769391.1 hypothetical protein [Bradyrhizobium sp. 134]
MAKENCLIVVSAGKKLDLLRSEAFRIAKENNADWWSERVDLGTRFCFVSVDAKKAFALTCDTLDIRCREG